MESEFWIWTGKMVLMNFFYGIFFPASGAIIYFSLHNLTSLREARQNKMFTN